MKNKTYKTYIYIFFSKHIFVSSIRCCSRTLQSCPCSVTVVPVAASVSMGQGGDFQPAPHAHAVLGLDRVRSPPTTGWCSRQWAPPPWTFLVKLGVSERARTHRPPPHAKGLLLCTQLFAHPRSCCVKLLRGGGSMKTPPWLGCKHPAGLFPGS